MHLQSGEKMTSANQSNYRLSLRENPDFSSEDCCQHSSTKSSREAPGGGSCFHLLHVAVPRRLQTCSYNAGSYKLQPGELWQQVDILSLQLTKNKQKPKHLTSRLWHLPTNPDPDRTGRDPWVSAKKKKKNFNKKLNPNKAQNSGRSDKNTEQKKCFFFVCFFIAHLLLYCWSESVEVTVRRYCSVFFPKSPKHQEEKTERVKQKFLAVLVELAESVVVVVWNALSRRLLQTFPPKLSLRSFWGSMHRRRRGRWVGSSRVLWSYRSVRTFRSILKLSLHKQDCGSVSTDTETVHRHLNI